MYDRRIVDEDVNSSEVFDGSLDHRLPQPGREGLLERRIRRFREAVAGECYDHLNLYALNAGNLLADLAARDKKAGYRALQEAEVERLRGAARLAAGGGAQRVRLAGSVRLGAATPDGMRAVLDLRSGAFALLPAPVIERAEAGATLAGLAITEPNRLMTCCSAGWYSGPATHFAPRLE